MKISCIVLILLILVGCATNPRPWTKKEKGILAWSVLAAAADTYTTIEMLDDGNYEMNPILGRYPSDDEVIIYMSVSELLTILVAHYYPKYRSCLLGGKALVNSYFTIHNRRLDEN